MSAQVNKWKIPPFNTNISQWIKDLLKLNDLKDASFNSLSKKIPLSAKTLKRLMTITELIPMQGKALESLMNIERTFDLKVGYALNWLVIPKTDMIKIYLGHNILHPALEGHREIEFSEMLFRLLAYNMRVKQKSFIKQAADIGIPYDTLKKWSSGYRFAAKTNSARKHLVLLEKYFNLPKGLLSNVNTAKMSPYEKSIRQRNKPKKDIAAVKGRRIWNTDNFSERNGLILSFSFQVRKQGYDLYLRRFSKKPTTEINKQWLDYVDYKTCVINPFDISRRDKKLWKTINESENVNLANLWFAHTRNQRKVAPTASRKFMIMDSYLSYCCLPKSIEGILYLNEYKPHSDLLQSIFEGEAMEPEEINFSMIADKEVVERYLNWLINKNDNAVAAIQFLSLVREFLEEDFGFFRNYPGFIKNIENWEEKCKLCSEQYKKLQHSLESSSQQRFSRNPRERLDDITELENPFLVLKDICLNLEKEHPPKSQRNDYAIWTRDRLLINLLITNPLRANTISQLSIFKNVPNDNQGMLRKIDGKWKLLIPKRFFKNLGSNERDDYRADISTHIYAILEEYLLHRKYLQGSESSYLFRAKKRKKNLGVSTNTDAIIKENSCKAMSNTTIYNIVKTITTRTIGIGFGSHSFRHIVATAWLKQNPEDYLTVAQILHDTLETVIKNYAHLSPNDGMRRYYKYLNESNFF